MNNALAEFQRLLEIMDKLRIECPWDRKQTNESLRHLTIEEVYELADAILENDDSEISKELGDLMLHIVFYAKIGEEKKTFNIADVLFQINEKLIRRHPHIFSDGEAADAEAVKNNWEKIKLAEGRTSVLEGVPNSLPAMVKAYRIQDKVRGVGFDWENKGQVWEKVKEEIVELEFEVRRGKDIKKLEDDFGDVLFALINYARFIGINPEDALERTNKKFINRFQYIEKMATQSGRKIQDLTLSEMDFFWDEFKQKFE